MTVALRSPELLGALIPVDNAPVDAVLKSDFHKYIQGMREIEDKQVSKQVEADDILKKFEKVCLFSPKLSSYEPHRSAEGVTHTAIPPYKPGTFVGRKDLAPPHTCQNTHRKT